MEEVDPTAARVYGVRRAPELRFLHYFKAHSFTLYGYVLHILFVYSCLIVTRQQEDL